MANDWLDEKGSDWLDKTPLPTPDKKDPLKSLDDLGVERQLASEAPKPETPATPLPEPLEAIDYAKVATDLENAAQDTLAAFSRLGRASVNLSKISISVSGDGPKGKALVDKANGFREQVDVICTNLKKISEEVASYKNTLPKETTPQV